MWILFLYVQVGFFPKEYVREQPPVNDEQWYYNYFVFIVPNKKKSPSLCNLSTSVSCSSFTSSMDDGERVGEDGGIVTRVTGAIKVRGGDSIEEEEENEARSPSESALESNGEWCIIRCNKEFYYD